MLFIYRSSSGMLLFGHVNWRNFCCGHGIRRDFEDNFIHRGDFNRKCKLDHNGHSVERDGGDNWSANRAKRHRLFDRNIFWQSCYGTRCHLYREIVRKLILLEYLLSIVKRWKIRVFFFFFRRCTQPTYCPNYNRDTLALVCVLSMLLGLVTLFSVSRCLN